MTSITISESLTDTIHITKVDSEKNMVSFDEEEQKVVSVSVDFVPQSKPAMDVDQNDGLSRNDSSKKGVSDTSSDGNVKGNQLAVPISDDSPRVPAESGNSIGSGEPSSVITCNSDCQDKIVIKDTASGIVLDKGLGKSNNGGVYQLRRIVATGVRFSPLIEPCADEV